MDRAAAKPFKILSAYLITAATTRPPRALERERRKVRGKERESVCDGKGGWVGEGMVSKCTKSHNTQLICT